MTNLKKLVRQRKPINDTTKNKLKDAAARLQATVDQTPGKEIDKKALASMLTRLRAEYKKKGYLKEDETTKATKLKKALQQRGAGLRVKEAKAEDLLDVDSPAVRMFAQVYLLLESPMNVFRNMFMSTFGRKLRKDLTASRMAYSPEQYLTLVISATFLVSILYFLFTFLFMAAGMLSLGVMLVGALIVPPSVFFVGLILPSSNAAKITSSIERELPFALRHMSIEIRAGVGIFKTMQSIAEADYGELSIGFKKILSEISKGTPTEDALENWAELTGSEAVKRVMSHIVRALKTGGNLSDIMVTIADDVSFERKSKIEDFAQKLNLMSLFLMMVAIVMPVMVGILTAVGTAPSIKRYVSFFASFDMSMLQVVYFVLVPGLILVFLFFIRSSDPGT